MLTLLHISVHCSNLFDNRICIENLQSVIHNEENLDNLVCCAFMSIINYRNNIQIASNMFTRLCLQSFEDKSIPPYCHVLVLLSLYRFFGPTSSCTSLLTIETMSRIDLIINKKMKTIYLSHIAKNNCYEGIQILVYAFVTSFFINEPQKALFLHEFIGRGKSIFNQNITHYCSENNDGPNAEKCLHFTEHLIVHGIGYESKCAECGKNKFYHRNHFDFDLIFSMLNAINEERIKSNEKRIDCLNQCKNVTNDGSIFNDTKCCKDDNTCDIAISLDFSKYDVDLVKILSSQILNKKLSINRKRNILDKALDNFVLKCYDELLNNVAMLSLKARDKISKIHNGTRIEFLDMNLFSVKDFAYFYMFRKAYYRQDVKDSIVDSIHMLRKTLLLTHRDVFHISTCSSNEAIARLEKSYNSKSSIYILTMQVHLF